MIPFSGSLHRTQKRCDAGAISPQTKHVRSPGATRTRSWGQSKPPPWFVVAIGVGRLVHCPANQGGFQTEMLGQVAHAGNATLPLIAIEHSGYARQLAISLRIPPRAARYPAVHGQALHFGANLPIKLNKLALLVSLSVWRRGGVSARASPPLPVFPGKHFPT